MNEPHDKAVLISERDFLLASIDDLDAEFEAGDLAEEDYQTLRDGYVARAARTIRSLESLDQDGAAALGAASGESGAPSQETARTGAEIDEPETAGASNGAGVGWKRRALVFVGAGAVAVLAGWALAQAVGYRSPADSGTGGVRQSVAGLRNEADALGAEGRWDEALEVYDEILDQDPDNAEALTYKGWVLHTQFGETQEASELLADAIVVDPNYPDARVFSAILARNRGDYETATENLVAFDDLDSVPQQMTMLVQNGQLRAEVLAERYLESFEADGSVVIDERFPIDESARAAVILDTRGDVVAAIATFDAVLADDPSNRLARLGLGRRLAATPELVANSPSLAERGLGLLDDAVADDPKDAEALAYRALARMVQGDEEGARSDLATLESFESLPEGLEPIIEELRRSLG